MTKESIKHKTYTKKSSNVSPKADFDTFFKNQQNIVSRLKTELTNLRGQAELSDNDTAKRDTHILELEQSVNQHLAEIHNLSTNLEQMKDANNRILMEFNFFKEKFYQLETEYDKNLNLQYQENENLCLQLQQQQTAKNQEIHELSLKCKHLEQTLQIYENDLAKSNKIQTETLQDLDQIKVNYEKQQKEFELYKNQVLDEKRLNEKQRNLDFANLKDELMKKDEILKQSISSKTALEKEKNLVIEELKNKICRIERAFNQPAHFVQPLMNLPNNSDYNSTSSNENVAVTFPHSIKPHENVQTLSNKEDRTIEQPLIQRNPMFKRPLQLPNNSQQSNEITNNSSQRKRRNQPTRKTAMKKTCYNEFSLSSSDEANDNDTNYDSFSEKLWKPKMDCYVADTDASEGFAVARRSK